jgi:hypothetical protein
MIEPVAEVLRMGAESSAHRLMEETPRRRHIFWMTPFIASPSCWIIVDCSELAIDHLLIALLDLEHGVGVVLYPDALDA